MISFSEDNCFNIYSIIILLFSIPSFYLFPSENVLSTSHSIASFLLIILFSLLVVRKNLLRDKKLLNIKLYNLIFLFVVSSSLSALGAINILDFLKVYKNIILGVIFFFCSEQLINSKKNLKKVLYFIILVVLINLIYRFVIFFKPVFLYQLFTVLIYDKYIGFVEVQANRSRFFVEFFDWVYIPIIIFLSIKEKNFFIRFLLIMETFLLFFFSILSGYRALFLICLFGLLISFFILKKKKYFLVVLIFLFIFNFLTLRISNSYSRITALTRFFNGETEEGSTTKSRFILWRKSLEMMEASYLIGIGLGNFYDYLPNNEKINISLFNWKNELMKLTLTHPHNALFSSLAETGLIGFVFLLSLITMFAIYDLYNFKENLYGFVMISFWLLFLLSMVEPNFILHYQITFWLLRAIIYKDRKILF